MKSVLLDTTAYSRLMAGDQRVLEAVAGAETVFVSVIIMGELHAAFAKGTRKKENRGILDRFLRKPTVKILPVMAETAEIFGEIKHGLQEAGTPIPINDIWISAQARETGAMLITYDAHFRTVPGLRLMDLVTG